MAPIQSLHVLTFQALSNYVVPRMSRHVGIAGSPKREALEEETEGWKRLRTAIDLILEGKLPRYDEV